MRIRWTDAAAQDLIAICDYTQEHHGVAQARQTAVRIVERIDSLHNFPRKGRLGRKADTRELVLTNLPFLAVYRVRENLIEVIRILHGAQRWP